MKIINIVGYLFLFQLIMLVCACEQNANSLMNKTENAPLCQKVDTNEFKYINHNDSGYICCRCINDSLYVLSHIKNDSVVDEWKLPYPLFQFDCADLTSDGVPEICVGVIKKTKYRPVMDKRLFIFKLHRGIYIRPLWLGSRVSNPLIDFKLENDSSVALIHTWEQTPDSVSQVIYRYHGFGIKFVKYHNQ